MMTENEAKFIFEEIKDIDDTLYSYSEPYMNALVTAIKALEEIQEYRKLGTVEKCRKAIEKNTPKKIIKKKDAIYYRSRLGEEKYLYKFFCPNCGNGDLKRGFPCKCGQKLNWGDE